MKLRNLRAGTPLLVGLAATVITTAAATDLLIRWNTPQSQAVQPAAAGQPAPAVTQKPASPSLPQEPGLPVVDALGWQWGDFQGIPLPVSPIDGPHVTTAGLASGYTDTPAGALLAAVNIVVRADAFAGPAVFQPTISHQVADDGEFLQAQRDVYAFLAHSDGASPHRLASRYLGYRWQSYTNAEAIVDVLRGDPTGTVERPTDLHSIRLHLRWSGTDWMLLPPNHDLWSTADTSIDSTAGYTLFHDAGAIT